MSIFPFDTLATRLAGTSGAAWGRDALRFEPVDIAAYELVFTQAGFVMPRSLGALLRERGAFELRSIDGDEAREAVHELRAGDARDILSAGLHLLSPDELATTLQVQRLAASAEVTLGSFWVFAAPHHYLHTEAHAFDVRFCVDGEYACVPFHEDDIGELVDIADGGPIRGASPSFEAWAHGLTEQLVRAVSALDGLELRASTSVRTPLDLSSYVAECNAGKPWSAWVEGIWRPALQREHRDVARRIVEEVGTLVTKPAEPEYRLPGALDLLQRLPREGAYSRRMGMLEMWQRRRPDDLPTLAPAMTYLVDHVHEAAPAPKALLDDLVAVAWRHRGPPVEADVSWARALLLALGTPEPARLRDATTLVLAPMRGRDLAETMWLRLAPFAEAAGVL